MELNKKKAKLEEKYSTLKKEKEQLREHFDKQIDKFRENEVLREKQMKQNLESLKEKQLEIKDTEEYRTNYMTLQKKI